MSEYEEIAKIVDPREFNRRLSRVGVRTNFFHFMENETVEDDAFVREILQRSGLERYSFPGVKATYKSPKSGDADIDKVAQQHTLQELHEYGLLRASLSACRETFGWSEKDAETFRSAEEQDPRLTVKLEYPLVRGVRTYSREEMEEFLRRFREERRSK